jgi:uncharacterized integral membrane protein
VSGPLSNPPAGPPQARPPGEQYGAPPPRFGAGPGAAEPGQAPPTSGPYPVEPDRPQGESTGETPKLPPAGFDDRGRVRRGTISAVWVGIVAAAIVLILLIIFIAQNLERVTIHFLGFSGSLPIGLIALISAVVGVLIAAVPGTVRILQLRKALKTNTPKEQRLP